MFDKFIIAVFILITFVIIIKDNKGDIFVLIGKIIIALAILITAGHLILCILPKK